MSKPPSSGRWKPGQSGNPGGRAKTAALSAAYRKKLEEKIPDTHAFVRQFPEMKGKTWAEAIAYGQVLSAIKGNTPAAVELANRTEGKVADKVSLDTGEGGMDPASQLLALVAAVIARKKE